MNLELIRYSQNSESTLGLLFVNDEFFSYTLENGTYQKFIPDGEYILGLQTELTPLTKKYRKKYNWFADHIEIKNVDGIKNAYIHIGNSEKDTDACILIGNQVNNNRIAFGFLGDSKNTFYKFYYDLYPMIKSGELVKLQICSILNCP